MKSKNIPLLLLTLLFFRAADAKTADNCSTDKKCFYTKFFAGANFLQNTTIDDNKCSYQTGYILAGSLGYFCYYGLHVEGEYAYRKNAIRKMHFFGQGSSEHGHFQTSSAMANLLWDLPLCSWGCRFWNIRPFIGTGIGCDWQQMHASSSRINFHQKWTHLSWQLMTGLAFPLFRNTDLTLEYKFHQGEATFITTPQELGLSINLASYKESNSKFGLQAASKPPGFDAPWRSSSEKDSPKRHTLVSFVMLLD